VTSIEFQVLNKKGTSLAKCAFFAVERCAMSIFIFISSYTRNFSLHSIYYVQGSIRNMPALLIDGWMDGPYVLFSLFVLKKNNTATIEK
jgi:hypothetical protein